MNKHDILVAPMLALVSFMLILVGFTDLGEMKTFRFVLGEMAMVTAFAYSFQTGRGVSKFAPLAFSIIWFAVASMNFYQAIWLAR